MPLPKPPLFELVYGNGGHGGPYEGLEQAQRWAFCRLQGSPTETTIYVVPHDKPFASEYAVAVARKKPFSSRIIWELTGK
jgi:hypothetical protein